MRRSPRPRALTFEQAIDLFRAQEQPEQIACLLDNPPLQRLVAVWDTARVTRDGVPFSASEADPLCDLWDRLWESCKVDDRDLATKTSQSLDQLRRRLGVLRGNRLIYPDGTSNNQARAFIRAQIGMQIGMKLPRNAEVGR